MIASSPPNKRKERKIRESENPKTTLDRGSFKFSLGPIVIVKKEKRINSQLKRSKNALTTANTKVKHPNKTIIC